VLLKKENLMDKNLIIETERYIPVSTGKVTNEYITGLLKDEWIKN
jgi:hypothetical protein